VPVDHLFQSPAVDIETLSPDQIRAWSECASSAVLSNPYFEPACQLPAVQYLDGAQGAQLVVAERGCVLVACLPIHTIVGRRGPFRLKVGHARKVSTPVGLGSPFVSAQAPDLALDGLLTALSDWSREGGPGIVVLDWLDDDVGGVGRTLRAACVSRGMPVFVRRTWERPVVRRSSEGLSLLSTLSKERRKELNRRRRRLSEVLGGPVQLVDRAKDPSAVDDFLRLEASGWKGRDGDAIALRPDTTQWFRRVCGNFASLGRLHMLSLEAAGHTVAMQCCLRSGRDVYLFRVGHDAEFNAYGPGVLVIVDAVEFLGSLDIDLVDSGASPDNEFLSGLFPERRQLSTIIIGTGGSIDRTAVRGLSVFAAVERVLARKRASGAPSTK
jgi:hypothetical protein